MTEVMWCRLSIRLVSQTLIPHSLNTFGSAVVAMESSVEHVNLLLN